LRTTNNWLKACRFKLLVAEPNLVAIGRKIYQVPFSVEQISDSFNPPATVEEIDSIEQLVGVKLPAQLRELYLYANGQSNEAQTGLWYGLPMLSTSEIEREWKAWYELFTEEGMQEFIYSDEHSSYKEGYIKPMYMNPKWVPLSNDSGGNHFGIDYDPGPKGTKGQIINFGRDEFVKYVLGDSFDDFLKWYVEQLEAGNYQINEFRCDDTVTKVLNTKFPSTEHFLDSIPELFK